MFTKRVFFVLLILTLAGLATSTAAQETTTPPLTEPGPYGVGMQVMTFVDDSRGDWELKTFIWYPIDKATKGTPVMTGRLALRDAPPDKSGAPYPLIVYSHGWTGSPTQLMGTMEHLTSHGYVVAAPQHHDTQPMRFELVDRPLDILVVLDGLAAIAEGDLAGMIDTDNVGLMGYSMGANTVLQMLGLLRDPVQFASWCAEHPDLATWDCNPTPLQGPWPLDEITAYRDQLGLQNTPDGQWAPFGDARVRAVLAMAPGTFPLTTEDMLASVTTPTLILHGTKDVIVDYEGNAVRTYTHLGTDERYLVTLIDAGHGVFGTFEKVPQHFASAFFGYYLQGDETYQSYLTPEHLPDWSSPTLAWGPYEAE
jgi:predicted dienelactone hydrolase